MKKTKIPMFLCTFCLIFLCACTATQSEGPGADVSQGPTWQEQYDLGVRYLSEGNYREAIIAFTAAIEINPKLVPAYVGRGDAHSGVARLAAGDAAELPREAVTSYENAVADYLAAIDLDGTDADVYLKAAEVYVALGEIDSAKEILERGYEITEDVSLKERLEQLLNVSSKAYVVDVNANIIANVQEYWDEIEENRNRNGGWSNFSMYGIRFYPAISVIINGQTVQIQEASLEGNNLPPLDNRDDNYSDFYNWEYFGKNVTVSGYIIFDPDYQRLYLDGSGFYHLFPNGPYTFYITEWAYEDESLNTK